MSRPDPTTDDAERWGPSSANRIGIAFSGGGIRAASFSLGIYQRLLDARVIERASLITGVSGGGYLASAVAITNACSDPQSLAQDPRPWARGSDEETDLRNNLAYLASGANGRCWVAANVLYGLILNLAPLIIASFVAGRLAGLVMRGMLGEDRLGGPDVDWQFLRYPVAIAFLLFSAGLIVVGRARYSDKARLRYRRSTAFDQRSSQFISAGLTVVTLGIGLPAAIRAVNVHLTPQAASLQDWSARLLPDRASLGVARFVLGSLAILALVVIGVAATAALRTGLAQKTASIFGVGCAASVLFVPFIIAAERSSTRMGSWTKDLQGILVASSVLIVLAVFAHSRRYSMHLFYRERLQSAFARRRIRDENTYRSQEIPYDEGVLLSEVAKANQGDDRPRFPELVLCAALAARGRDVPTQRNALSYLFEGGTCGPANDRYADLRQPTSDLEREDWMGGGRLTLPSMMAISGAAVSPLMGRFTLPVYRFLMAVFNLRLGVWIWHPARRPEPLPPPTKSFLWCVRDAPRWVLQYLKRGWDEPGGWYVLKEALGVVGLRDRFTYISDGGHWENLGVVELLRRNCTHVIVVDASGDPNLSDLARAMAIARSDLAVDLSLKLGDATPGPERRASAPAIRGTIRYPGTGGDRGRSGELYLVRSVLWDEAPDDLLQLADRDQTFPNHSTTNQFLSAELFDGYRALGWEVAGELLSIMHLPNPAEDETGVQARTAEEEEAPS